MSTYIYRVGKDEKLEDIAAKFGISMSALLHDNNCVSEQIDEGIRLLINMPEGREYIVKPFDTIASVALKFGKSENYIKENNNIDGEIFIGQKLYI